MSILWLTIVSASLLGLSARPESSLSSFWPANGLLLGLFIRNPEWASIRGWIVALFAYMSGEIIWEILVGGGLPVEPELFYLMTIWLALANLTTVVICYGLFRRISQEDRLLKRPVSILWLLVVTGSGAALASLVGVGITEILFERERGLLMAVGFWFSTEWTNVVVTLPVVLLAPSVQGANIGHAIKTSFFSPLRRVLPLLALILSVLIAVIVGGPGAIAFPLPALIWCAFSYSTFITATMTFVICAWSLIAISFGILHVPLMTSQLYSMMSLRLGIMFFALTPLLVSIIWGVRNDLLKKLDRAITHDYLTDALTRRAFIEKGQTIIRELQESGRPVALLLMDLDFFKRINDEHGHAAGDHVLVHFSHLLKSLLRSQDLFGRLGGEEFGLLLPRTEMEQVLHTAQHLLKSVAAMEVSYGETCLPRITVSIGIVGEKNPTRSLDQLLSYADEALYQAKDQGRNRYVLSGKL